MPYLLSILRWGVVGAFHQTEHFPTQSCFSYTCICPFFISLLPLVRVLVSKSCRAWFLLYTSSQDSSLNLAFTGFQLGWLPASPSMQTVCISSQHWDWRHMWAGSALCGCWGPKLRASSLHSKCSHLLNHSLPNPPQPSPAPQLAENSPAPWSQEHISLLEPTSLERALLSPLPGNSHKNRLEAGSF